MAQSLRRPFSCILGVSSSTSQRCFSRYHPLSAADKKAEGAKFRPASSPERSLRVASKGAQYIPSDMGLLEFTYIPPTGKNLPSPLTSPNDFLHVQWNRIRFSLRNAFSLLVLKFSAPANKKRGIKTAVQLKRSTIVPTAVALHRRMYTAFGNGDLQTLQKICTEGILESFRSRVGNRSAGSKVQWELVKLNRSPKLVSHRAARLPIDGAAVIQAVVRVSSKQRLTRWNKEKGVLVQVEGTGKERDVVEYVVVQQLYKNWKAGEWMVWGTTNETLLDDVDEWKRREAARE